MFNRDPKNVKYYRVHYTYYIYKTITEHFSFIINKIISKPALQFHVVEEYTSEYICNIKPCFDVQTMLYFYSGGPAALYRPK